MGPRPDIVAAVDRLRRRLGDDVPLTEVILFGSQARGDAAPESDVDLIVVSPAFEGRTVAERAAPLYLAWDLDVPVDFICYTPREFQRLRGRVSLVRTALDEGARLTA